ncbi:MAG: outer membrane lipoprotein-sorting protein, partial [Spirochaetia bacterium]|nr:outer membrane lipoprotein-sorting protein [Spirochaetia bacterium]
MKKNTNHNETTLLSNRRTTSWQRLGLGLITAIVFGASTLFSQAVDGKALLKKMDENQKLGGDLTAKISIVQQKANQNPKKLESLYYRRDSDDSFIIIMLAPDVEKGNGYLRVKDNFWMYRQNTRNFQHINRDENISGTDLKGGDFETRKMSDLYEPAKENGKEKLTEEMLGQIAVYRLEIIAKVSDVTYPKQTLWIEKGNFVPRKILNYSLSGSLMQSQYFPLYMTT